MFIVSKFLKSNTKPHKFIGSQKYWINRYGQEGNSGPGSYQNLAEFKGRIINDFVSKNNVYSIIELGCGDGNQLEYFNFKSYIGFDISHLILEKCRLKFKNDKSKQFLHIEECNKYRADLTLSLDVIYHLIEDRIFHNYMNQLFDLSKLFVIIYSCNFDDDGTFAHHVKPRKFMDWITNNRQDFELLEFIPNEFPFDSEKALETTFADFYIFKKVI
jgi:SAM-dependent methyltransferase